MMDIRFYIVVLTVYFIIGSVLALISRKFGIKSSIDYFVGSYRLSGFLSAMTYAATTYSAFMMIGLVGFVYTTGIGAFLFESAYLVATVILLKIFAFKVWLWARRNGWVSPAEMLGSIYGSKLLASVISLVYLVALIPYATAQLVGLGRLFEGLSLDYTSGVAFGIVASLIWIILAGIWSVAITDAYQGVWMITAAIAFTAWIIAFLLPNLGLSLGGAVEALIKEGTLGITGFWTPQVFLAFTLPWIFFAITNPQVVQRIFMPKSKDALRNMIKYFTLFGAVYTVLVTIIGLFAKSLTLAGKFPDLTLKRDLVTPTLIQMANPLLGSIVFVSIVAASISTLDSIVLTLSSSLFKDILSQVVKVRKELRLVYATTVALIALIAMVALAKPGFVIELSVLSSVMLLPLAPITLAAWIKPEKVAGKHKVALLSLLIGVIIGLYAAVVIGPEATFTMTLLNAPLSFWILIISSIIVFLGLKRS